MTKRATTHGEIIDSFVKYADKVLRHDAGNVFLNAMEAAGKPVAKRSRRLESKGRSRRESEASKVA